MQTAFKLVLSQVMLVSQIEFRVCKKASDFEKAKAHSKAYLEWLGMDLSYQKTEYEFHVFEKMYGTPSGCFLLAIAENEFLGGVGLRKLENGICEMKRLYVYPKFQKNGIGEILCKHLIGIAKALGYNAMKLDTVAKLQSAIYLYKKLGFKETDAYCENPDKTARFFELSLK
ncbi:MAG: GNAT family N-acetyltransferase [Bacteroidia bacterium]